ncbi:hypothetical protein ACEPPN_016142 [Leptodophora sp. 'Broadleaf-Isolate-01']
MARVSSRRKATKAARAANATATHVIKKCLRCHGQNYSYAGLIRPTITVAFAAFIEEKRGSNRLAPAASPAPALRLILLLVRVSAGAGVIGAGAGAAIAADSASGVAARRRCIKELLSELVDLLVI